MQETQVDPADFAVGVIIAGKFRVERIIGAGAMGIVLAARHLELDETVALKFIQPELQKVPGVLSRFAREAKACVRIKSDHVAKVLDVGIADRLGPYIVMEYLEGKDLAQLLADSGPLSIRRATEYVMQTCEALALAHSMGITHRDIKPGNLFLVRRGDLELIKVLDFGISKAALTGRIFGDDVSLVETSGMMGTPLYMSPEQIRATNEVDQRSDIWSLGVALYELLSGESAFFAEGVMQVCALVLESDPTSLVTHRPGLPLDLQRVVERCLQKDPAARYQNVAELAQALAPFAPSRARVHADRAASVLRKPSQDSSIDLQSQVGLDRIGSSRPPARAHVLEGQHQEGHEQSRPPETPTHISPSASARAKAFAPTALSLDPVVDTTAPAASLAPAPSRKWMPVALAAVGLVAVISVAFGVSRSGAGGETAGNGPGPSISEPSARQNTAPPQTAPAAVASTAQTAEPAAANPSVQIPAAANAAQARSSKSPKSWSRARGKRASEAPANESRTAPQPASPEPAKAKSRVRLIDSEQHVRLLH